jgi:hypothetical protein
MEVSPPSSESGGIKPLNNMKENIVIELSHDQAFVFSHMLYRFQQTDQLALANNAEYLALSTVSGQLDTALVEPLMSNYDELLIAARERIAGGYEGLAPGVEPDADDVVAG